MTAILARHHFLGRKKRNPIGRNWKEYGPAITEHQKCIPQVLKIRGSATAVAEVAHAPLPVENWRLFLVGWGMLIILINVKVYTPVMQRSC